MHRRQCLFPRKNLEPRRKTEKRVDEMHKQKVLGQRPHTRMPIGGGAAVRRIQADQSRTAESISVGHVAHVLDN
jgi:hypothetical protein